MEQDTTQLNRDVELTREGQAYKLKITPIDGVAAGNPITIRFKLLAERDLTKRSLVTVSDGGVVETSLTSGALDLDKVDDLTEVAQEVSEAVEGAIEAINQAKKNVQILKQFVDVLWPEGLEGPLNIDEAALGTNRNEMIIDPPEDDEEFDMEAEIARVGYPGVSDNRTEIRQNGFFLEGVVYQINDRSSRYVLELDEHGKFNYVKGEGFKYVRV